MIRDLIQFSPKMVQIENLHLNPFQLIKKIYLKVYLKEKILLHKDLLNEVLAILNKYNNHQWHLHL